MISVLQNEDAAQEAFARLCEKLWKGIAGFRAQSSWRTWIHHIAWNAARDLRKEAYRRRALRLETAEPEQLAAEVSRSTLPRLRQARVERIAQVTAGLDLPERSLLLLRAHPGALLEGGVPGDVRDGRAGR